MTVMTTEAPPHFTEPDHLTQVLHKAGALDGSGRVAQARVVHSFATVLSRLHRLKLDYEGAADAPRHLYLKTGLPGGAGGAWNSGLREVTFYATVAPATPPGLLPRCFDAAITEAGDWHLLLEDLTDTHAVPTEWPLPPTLAQTETIVRCRARFQAAWWDHPRLGVDIGAWLTDAELETWLATQIQQYEAFAGALGDRLSAPRRALYEALFAQAPRLLKLLRRRRQVTIIQGDAHVWNCFLPRDNADTPRLFDWDSWRAAIGTDDLAYMLALHWYPEMRQRAEGAMLDAFHQELLAGGVTGYDRHALQDDYRLSVLWQILRPIRLQAARIPPAIWWPHVERIHLAADDLGCRELLG
jgi:hypothetical protein